MLENRSFGAFYQKDTFTLNEQPQLLSMFYLSVCVCA